MTVDTRTRVVHIITGLRVGGAERMLAKLITAFAGRFDSHVISLTTDGPVGEDLRRGGAQVHAIRMAPRLGQGVAAFVRLVRLLRRLKPDVVHTWMYHGDLIGGAAARLAGVRAVAWNIRNSDLSATTKLTTRSVVRLSAWASRVVPSVIVCCSESARQIHERAGYDKGRFIVIPNGFDVQSFKPDSSARLSVRQECGIPVDSAVIGLIARFDPQKDHESFCAAAARLHTARPTVHYLLAGTGVDSSNPQLREWLAQAGVAHVTHLLGDRRDTPRLTAALDVATSCSAWGESFSNTLGEAAACGVPCVATDVGDAAAILGESGWLVPRRDVGALADAWDTVLGLSAEERRRAGDEARARVSAQFEIGHVARRYAELYESLAGGDCRV